MYHLLTGGSKGGKLEVYLMTVYYIRQQHLLTTHTLVIFFRCDRRGVARRPPPYPHSYSTRSPFGACLLNVSPQPSLLSEGVDPPQCCQLSPLSSEYLRDHSYIFFTHRRFVKCSEVILVR